MGDINCKKCPKGKKILMGYIKQCIRLSFGKFIYSSIHQWTVGDSYISLLNKEHFITLSYQ